MKLAASFLVVLVSCLLAGCGSHPTDTLVGDDPPEIALVQPQAGATLGAGTTLLRASVSDQSAVQEVIFFANGRTIGRCEGAPLAIAWEPMGIGPHTLHATAVDAQGARIESRPVQVRVTSPFDLFVVRPAAWERVAGVVPIRVVVAGEVQLARVTFYTDGDSVGSTDEAPFEILWDAAGARIGNHTVYARAIDSEGLVGMSTPIVVEVIDAVDRVAPTASFLAPVPWQEIGGPITIRVHATDNVGVDRVEFFVDGVLIGVDTTAPYEQVWDPASAEAGVHGIYAWAYDAAGNRGLAGPVAVTVRDETDRIPPSVVVLAPAPWQRIAGTVDLSARAWDNRGVDRVDFYIDFALIGSVQGAGPDYTYVGWDSGTVAEGNHTLSAWAYDAAGNFSHAAVPIEVRNAPLGPMARLGGGLR